MDAAASASSTTTTASVTDEEIEALLATRPWRDHDVAPLSEDEQEKVFARMFNDPTWSTSMLGFEPSGSATVAAPPPPPPPQQQQQQQQQQIQLQPPFPATSSDMEWESREPTFSDQRAFVYASPSSFEAQFFEGTPEQDALLQALEEQQQLRDQEQQQQQQQLYPHSPHLLHPYELHTQPTRDTPSYSPTQTQPSMANLHMQQQSSLLYDYARFSDAPSSSQSQLFSQTHAQQTAVTPAFAWRGQGITQQQPIGSPQSDVFSSPEMAVRRTTRVQGQDLSGSSHSLLEKQQSQHPSLSLTSSPSYLSPTTSSSAVVSLSPVDLRQMRRSSTEIRTLQQRRQVRRTYAGPSPSASLIDVNNSASGRGAIDSVISGADGRNRARVRPARPLSSSGPHHVVDTTGRLRADGIPMSASYSSEEYSHYNDTYSVMSTPPHLAQHPEQRGAEHVSATVPTSLSAELAGLGIDPDNFYDPRQDDVFMDNDISESNSNSHTFDTSTHRTSASSSASTTRRNKPTTGDNSLFSQNTTFSSGLDESLLSAGSGAVSGGDGGVPADTGGVLEQIHSSRWIHGRDTPPSTPSRGSLGPSPSSVAEIPAAAGKPASLSFTHVADQTQQQQQPLADSRASLYPRTWPRSTSEGTSAAVLVASANAAASKTSSTQHSPSLASSGGAVGPGARSPDTSIVRVRSPMFKSRSDTLTGRLATQTRPRRTPSLASSSSSSFLSQPDGQSARQASRLPAALEMGHQHSSESLPSHTAFPNGIVTASGAAGTVPATEQRNKRWSSVILSTPPPLSSHEVTATASRRRGGAGRMPRPEQYEQVSAALETLRTFLRQRERPAQQQQNATSAATNTASRRSTSNRSIPFATANTVPLTPPMHDGRSSSSDAAFEGKNALSVSPTPSTSSDAVQVPSSTGTHSMHSGGSTMASARSRTLRHPPPGPLPPRGSLHAEHSFVPASPTSSSMTLVAGHNHHHGNDSDVSWPAVQSRVQMGTTTSGGQEYGEHAHRPRPRHHHTASSSSMDRIAALEDLAVRVRRMRDEEQQQSH